MYHYTVKIVQIRLRLDDKPPIQIKSSLDAEIVLTGIYKRLHADQEHLAVLGLDRHKNLLAVKVIASGPRDFVRTTLRDVIFAAADMKAEGIVLAHNHTGTDPTPTADDIKLEKAVRKIANQLQLTVHDHIILASPVGARATEPWTDADIENLIALVNRNAPKRTFKTELRRSLAAIGQKARQLAILLPWQKPYL